MQDALKYLETSIAMNPGNKKLAREDADFISLKDNSYFRLTFDDKVEDAIWIGLLEENINYLQKFLQFASELINSGKMLDSSSQKKVEKWKGDNINPLIEFSEKFNSILEISLTLQCRPGQI